jgi:hypothetical protein
MLDVPTKHYLELLLRNDVPTLWQSERSYKEHVPSTAFSERSNTYLTMARIFFQIKKLLKGNKHV